MRDVTTPSLVCPGAADILPRSVTEGIAGLLRHATLRTLVNVGHHPFREAPRSFFAHVETLLAEPPLDS